MVEITPRLGDFAGDWDVRRIITDHRGGPNGRFAGSARFSAHPDGLTYSEIGELLLGDHPPFKAERQYLWRADGDRITVEFQDGRPFHSFDPSAPNADHWCDPDTYRVTYEFSDWPNWRSVWDVTGPKKAYEMITEYTRPNQ